MGHPVFSSTAPAAKTIGKTLYSYLGHARYLKHAEPELGSRDHVCRLWGAISRLRGRAWARCAFLSLMTRKLSGGEFALCCRHAGTGWCVEKRRTASRQWKKLRACDRMLCLWTYPCLAWTASRQLESSSEKCPNPKLLSSVRMIPLWP